MLKAIEENKFLETANVFGENIYGTSFSAVVDVVEQGLIPILDIDVQGARQIRKSPIQAHFIFIKPPSMEVLEQRLRGR